MNAFEMREAAAKVAEARFEFETSGLPDRCFDLQALAQRGAGRILAKAIRAIPIEENLYTLDERVKETADFLRVGLADVVMVERVAQAIYEEDDAWHKAWPWPNLNPEAQGGDSAADAYRRLARAAISALNAETCP